MIRMIMYFLLTVIVVVFTSAVSSRLWGGKPEQIPEGIEIIISENMKIAELGEKYGLEKESLKKIFGLKSPDDLTRPVTSAGFSAQQLNKKVNQALALQAEHATKNWFKIPLKGGLWILYLIVVFLLLRKHQITARSRKGIYIAAFVIFGVILGSDPSPMGTVKDAIILFGSKGVVYPPRLIAFTLFLLMVFVANKFICSWGCQLGTLQDLIFRLNRNSSDRTGLTRQLKVPFVLSNLIRVLFFIALTVGAFVWGTDIVERIDPFKIFKPEAIGVAGGILIGLILIASLWVYRPWCHFFCPFGLVGWLIEPVSIFKIKVDYDKCISCEACSKACPSTVMGAILKQNRVIPDCFSCGTCIGTCPVKAISFEKGKRGIPLEDKFTKTRENNSDNSISL